MHLNGARLWEAVVGAGSLKDYAACFDSIQLCFTKGLGAPIASVVVGNADFVERALWMRHMLERGFRAAGVITAPPRVAVKQVYLGGR